MTSEEYVVNRLQEIEEENHHLWLDREESDKRIKTLEKDLKWVLGLFKVREGTLENERVIELDSSIYEKYDHEEFVFLYGLLDKLRLEKEAEAWE